MQKERGTTIDCIPVLSSYAMCQYIIIWRMTSINKNICDIFENTGRLGCNYERKKGAPIIIALICSIAHILSLFLKLVGAFLLLKHCITFLSL